MESVLVVTVSECTPESIRAVAHRFASEAQVSILSLEGEAWQITLRPVSPDADIGNLIAAFKAELLDQQVRLDLEKRTGKLRELIYRAAFEPAERRRRWWRR